MDRQSAGSCTTGFDDNFVGVERQSAGSSTTGFDDNYSNQVKRGVLFFNHRFTRFSTGCFCCRMDLQEDKFNACNECIEYCVCYSCYQYTMVQILWSDDRPVSSTGDITRNCRCWYVHFVSRYALSSVFNGLLIDQILQSYEQNISVMITHELGMALFGSWWLTPLSTIFQCYHTASFIGVGNRSTRRQLQNVLTCYKLLTKFNT